jgi:hypothetical protein
MSKDLNIHIKEFNMSGPKGWKKPHKGFKFPGGTNGKWRGLGGTLDYRWPEFPKWPTGK